MSKAERRDGLEQSVANLEVFEGAITTAAEQLAVRMGELASEGVSLQDLEWTGRVSDVAERIMGPLERLFNEINEVPTNVTIVEEAKQGDDEEAERAILQDDITAIASGRQSAIVEQAETIPKALSEREKRIWGQIISGGSRTEWFGQKDLDTESIGFSSPSAKNQAFSQFCKKAVEAGILISNGKEKGGRRYMIATDAPISFTSWTLDEKAESRQELGVEVVEAEEQHPENSVTLTDSAQETPGEDEEAYDPRFEVTIRGQTHSFTPLEYRIIKAMLEGREGTREIIAHLNGNEGLQEADPDFYRNEFQPALKRLENLLIGDIPLVKARFVEGPGGKFIRFRLPEGARIESKKGVETLRFTDSSTLAGTPGSRSRRRIEEEAGDYKDEPSTIDSPTPHTEEASPVIQKTTRAKLPEPVSSARLSETGLVGADGQEIALEPQRKAILNALRSGSRMTVADIAKQINPEGGDDATFRSIVADELGRLQKLIGTTKLRRKQKPGTQAKWWLESNTNTA